MQNYIFSADIFLQCAGEIEFDGFGHFEPCLACGHAGTHISAAYTGGESSQRPVSAGMGVGADNQFPGGDQSFFGEEGVFNAHFSYIIVV